jgi:hypothetical protein
MNNKSLVKSLVTTLILFSNSCILSQELNKSVEEYIEDTQETAAVESETESAGSELTEDLVYYLHHPLNLNTATREDLYKLQFLNDYQIEALIDYRVRNDLLKSVYELLYVPGFTEHEVEMLQAFVTCNPAVKKFRIDSNLFKSNENEILARWQRILEKQEGYRKQSDSIARAYPDKSGYLGSCDKLYLRYRFSMKNRIKGSILAEKDPGEEFFKGSNSQGFDFYSAYLLYSNNHSFLRSVVIGDYHMQMGQGLLAWSSYSLGKSGYISSLCKRSSVIAGNISAEENRFLRGAASTIGLKNYSLTVFGSENKIDASSKDSRVQNQEFSSFTETGNHNTKAEIAKENFLTITAFGAVLRYDCNKLKIGINAIHTGFSKSLEASTELYKAFSFSGKSLWSYSVDYRYLAGTLQLFGESAISYNGIASLNGLVFLPKPGLTLAVVYHYYQPAYYSYYANAFSEGSGVSNENGFFFTGELRNTDFRIKMYGDVFSFPWLKYNVNAPSDGYEYYIEAGKKISNIDVCFRFKLSEKPVDYKNDRYLAEIRPFERENYRLNIMYPIGVKVILQNRVEVSRSGYQDLIKGNGYLIFQDISWHNNSKSAVLSLRAGYFNVVSYDSRIYAYEKDILYSAATQMCYGKGWRFMAMLKWQPKKYISVWIRLGHFFYPGEKNIGSGLDAIQGDHKTEIKVQLIFKF